MEKNQRSFLQTFLIIKNAGRCIGRRLEDSNTRFSFFKLAHLGRIGPAVGASEPELHVRAEERENETICY